MSRGACQLCGTMVSRKGQSSPRHCQLPNVASEPGCWAESADAVLRACARSLEIRGRRMPRDLSRIVLLRDLGLASEKGEAEIIRWLRTRPHDECLALIRCVPLDFVQSLTNWVEAAHGPRPLPELIVPKIPEDLPPSLRDGVSRFQARITGRYKQLIAKGHSRSSDYLSRPLFTAIRMARFFAHRGLTQWDALRKQNDDHLEMLHVQAWYFQTRHFPRMAWVRLNAPQGTSFITSDRAVAWIVDGYADAPPSALRDSSAQVVAPLTSTIALVGRHRSGRLNVTPRDVNRFIAAAATDWVAGSSLDTVEQALLDRTAAATCR